MGIFSQIRADLSRWPGLIDPLAQRWYKMTLPKHDGRPTVSVMCPCSQDRTPDMFNELTLPSEPSGRVRASRATVCDFELGTSMLFYVGQCPDCLTIHWEAMFGTG
jgi:hypothetical protein